MSNSTTTIRSTQPPASAATMPAATPAAMASVMAAKATRAATRVPKISRLNKSRPTWSVPSQWRRTGPLNRFEHVQGLGIVGGEPRGRGSAQQHGHHQQRADPAGPGAEQPVHRGKPCARRRGSMAA